MRDNAEVRRNPGLAYYKKGDLAAAAREFEIVRKRQPKDTSLAILLADSEIRLGGRIRRAGDADAYGTGEYGQP